MYCTVQLCSTVFMTNYMLIHVQCTLYSTAQCNILVQMFRKCRYMCNIWSCTKKCTFPVYYKVQSTAELLVL